MSAKLDRKANPSKPQLFSLNFIRVVLTLMIIMYHFDGQVRAEHPGSPIVWSLFFFGQVVGDLAVTLFIMLSGASLMVSTREDFSLTAFLRRRMLGIYPSYWVCFIAATFTVFLVTTRLAAAKPWTLLLSVVGMDGFLTGTLPTFYVVGEWFMGFILLMYLMFPLLRTMALRRPIILIAAEVVFIIVLQRKYSQWFTLSEIRNPFMRIPDFTFGLFFILYLRRFERVLSIFAFAILIWFAVKQRIMNPELYGLLLGLSFFLVLSQTAQYAERFKSFASFINKASKLSFGAFLIHHQIIYLLLAHFAMASFTPISVWVLFTAVVGLSFAGSLLLQKPIEIATQWSAIPISVPVPRFLRVHKTSEASVTRGAAVVVPVS